MDEVRGGFWGGVSSPTESSLNAFDPLLFPRVLMDRGTEDAGDRAGDAGTDIGDAGTDIGDAGTDMEPCPVKSDRPGESGSSIIVPPTPSK